MDKANVQFQALERLPGEKVIFTNGSKRHAENVTSHLGIHTQFKAIFDIVDANFTPKPEKRIYKVLLECFSNISQLFLYLLNKTEVIQNMVTQKNKN